MHSRRALSMVCPSHEGSNPLGLTFGGMVHPQTNSRIPHSKQTSKDTFLYKKFVKKVYKMQVSYHEINHGQWVQKSFNLSFTIYHSFISNISAKVGQGGNGTKFQPFLLVGRSCPSTHFSYDLVSRRMSQLCCRVTMQF